MSLFLEVEMMSQWLDNQMMLKLVGGKLVGGMVGGLILFLHLCPMKNSLTHPHYN